MLAKTIKRHIINVIDDFNAMRIITSKSWSQFIKYLLLPRPSELYKTLFTVSGYACACFCLHASFRVSVLLCLLFLFEFLAYGARYQINDILGIAEDHQVGRTRIFAQDEAHPWIKIIASILVAVLRLEIAILGAFLIGGQIMQRFFLSYILLLLSTILYEGLKTIRNRAGAWSAEKPVSFGLGALDYSVYAAVGTGYPLRFLSGLWVGYPTFGWNDFTTSLVCFLSSLWLLGVFASLLSWASSISSFAENQKDIQPAYLKQYYWRIHHFLKLRNTSQACCGKGKERLLRRQASYRIEMKSPWNQFYIAAVLCSFLAVAFCNCLNSGTMLLALAAAGLALGNILTGNMGLPVMVLVQYLFLLTALLKTRDPWQCIFLINMAAIGGIYAFLRYEPFIGEDALSRMKGTKQNGKASKKRK